MKINSKIHCGIKAIVDIAVNSNENGVMQKEIAERNNLSVKFLDHIISALRTSGLIHKKLGSKKGYVLSRDPSEITIYQVYRAFEPELGINPCLVSTIECPQSDFCASHCFLDKFNNEIKAQLEGTTIEQLKELQLNLNVRKNEQVVI